jgi:agmatine deiminase
MPPEWAPHQYCLVAWPTRRSLWGERFDLAKADYAEVARTIAGFESVMMICRPGDAGDVLNHCGSGVDIVEIEIDDSWTRDSGPIFVINDQGGIAVVDFGFNAWGGKYPPYDHDAAVTKALADVFGAKRYDAPFVLEGGSFFVDGEGTLVTTEGPVLDPHRNPDATKELFEQVVCDYLGVDLVLWLVAAPDRDTDGHIDGIGQYVRPGVLLLATPAKHHHENYSYAKENLSRLGGATDASGRVIEVIEFDIIAPAPVEELGLDVAYLNFYLANGAVVLPLAGAPTDELALLRLKSVFPDRDVVGVPGTTLAYGGGGGPHCITQQMPIGTPVSARLTRVISCAILDRRGSSCNATSRKAFGCRASGPRSLRWSSTQPPDSSSMPRSQPRVRVP